MKTNLPCLILLLVFAVDGNLCGQLRIEDQLTFDNAIERQVFQSSDISSVPAVELFAMMGPDRTGPGKPNEPMTVKVGDHVIYGKHSGSDISIGG